MCARYVRWRRNGRGRRKLRQPELHAGHSRKFYSRLLLLPPFPNLGPAHRVFNLHVLWSCACFSFMSSCSVTPPQFRPPYLSASTHFHVLITTSSSVFLSTWPNHLRVASLIFSLMFATPALALISSFLIFSILFIAVMPVLFLTLSLIALNERSDLFAVCCHLRVAVVSISGFIIMSLLHTYVELGSIP